MTDTVRSRFGRTLGNLALAALNATLILLALCLFLGLRLAGTVERVADGAAEAAAAQMAELTPLRDEVAGVREAVEGLRADLAELEQAAEELHEQGGAAAEARLQAVADALDARAEAVEARLAPLAELADQARDVDVGALIDRALAEGFDEAGAVAQALRGCVPSAPVAPDTTGA